MYEAVTGTARPKHPHGQRGIDHGQEEMAAGERDDQPGNLEPKAGQRHDADDDACGCRRGADPKNSAGAALEGAEETPRRQRALAAQEAQRHGEHGGPEDGAECRRARDHEDGNRDERGEVVAVAAEERRCRPDVGNLAARSHPSRISLDHQQDRQVVEHRRDARHHQDLQVRDLEELGDEECCRTERRRRDEGPMPAAERMAPASADSRRPSTGATPRSQHHGRGHAAA